MIENTSTHSAAFLAVLRHLFLVWTVIWILLRLISNAEAAISRTAKDVTTITAVSKVLRLIVFVIGGLAVMQTSG
ncbi:mechanosensitive ion channel [Photobacterium aphoticum]|uniref:Mechanosensitive ion channel n=1 Tax=Photobacterium aphoticum TaxID=754436 RepID=A0A090QTR0_9GAMM|nr:mechanosensitive ion channel [Photobacterium aphoticum]